MSNQNEVNQKGGRTLKFLKRYITQKVIIGIGIVLVLGVGAIGLRKFSHFESKTTKIGFEDIGELATQAAYCTEINLTDVSRELFGVTIPFTQSKYIYSYDVVIKAGIDFAEVELTEKNDTTIEVKLPEAKILSSEIKLESFKIYHEQESIFREITMKENNEAMTTLVENAKDDAVANGLLENARSNSETILTGFLAGIYDLDKYEITFIDK